MLDDVDPQTIHEVRDFMSRRRGDYISFLNAVSSALHKFKDSQKFQPIIYRIYSRADKQAGGDPLKNEFKIAKKLTVWRKTNPSCAINSIHDIIGTTVVVFFSSQVNDVASGLRDNMLEELKMDNEDPKNDDGYHAIHFIASSIKPMYSGLRCEIQVKTLLHDGWAAKTHDLTYKPRGVTDSNLVKHMQILGDSIEILEKQSDIIKEIIEKAWAREKRRRESAQRELLLSVTKDKNVQDDQELYAVVSEMGRDIDTLRACDQGNETLGKYFLAWKDFVEKRGNNRSTSRVITLLAGLRQTGDLNLVALEAIDSWVRVAPDGLEKRHAIQLRSLANYAFGLYSDAIVDGERALKYALSQGIPTDGVSMNLAYFIAEAAYHQGSEEERKNAKARCLTLIEDVMTRNTSDGFKSKFMDTHGAVLISCGESEEEVRRGLKFCRDAFELVAPSSDERPAAEAFFKLHEQRAFQRLEEWD